MRLNPCPGRGEAIAVTSSRADSSDPWREPIVSWVAGTFRTTADVQEISKAFDLAGDVMGIIVAPEAQFLQVMEALKKLHEATA